MELKKPRLPAVWPRDGASNASRYHSCCRALPGRFAPSAKMRTPGLPRVDGNCLRLPKIGEQPDRITASIPAQPTLSKHGPDTARIWTVQPAAPRPVHIPTGAVFHPRESWAHRSDHRLKSSQQQLSAARRGMRVPFHRICRFFIKLPCPKQGRPAGAPFGGPKAFTYYTRNGRGLSRPVFQRHTKDAPCVRFETRVEMFSKTGVKTAPGRPKGDSARGDCFCPPPALWAD